MSRVLKEEENIDESNYTHNEIVLIQKWEDYNLKSDLLRGIYGIGFEKPSFIQKAAVQPIIEGRDVRAQAQSGTGKTGAFAVGALQVLDENAQVTQVLVLVSTREIAAQNAKRFMDIGKYMNVKVVLLAGGTPVSTDQSNLSVNPHVVVGTPGRVEHMINSGYLKTSHIRLFIIDEADEMLKAGFQEQVKSIFMTLPREKLQIAMFSATYDQEELDVSAEILDNPIVIDLRYNDQTLRGIRQYYINLGAEHAFAKGDLSPKVVVLLDIFKDHNIGQSIVFINQKEHAKAVYSGLCKASWPCELIHSDLTQSEREEVLDRFRNGTNRCLISSGLLSRGVDVQNLSVVFCLDVPTGSRMSSYIHRIGRSGRYGRKGIAINIIFDGEYQRLKDIEKYYNTEINPFPRNFNFQE